MRSTVLIVAALLLLSLSACGEKVSPLPFAALPSPDLVQEIPALPPLQPGDNMIDRAYKCEVLLNEGRAQHQHLSDWSQGK